MSVMIRFILRLLAVALLGLALGAPLTGTAQARPFPDRIELPSGFQPEGITIGWHATAYLGSRANGDIYAVSLRTGERRLISEGLGSDFPSVGLKIDNRGRLFVAGGPSGTGRVIDVRTGKIIRNYTFTTETSFVNDVVLTRDYAWFTDSQQAQLYGVPLGRGGRPGGPTEFVALTLSGEWEQVAGVINANGIAQTPNRKALLVVNSTTGFLYRVDPLTGVATQVHLGGASLTNGDGLLVRGRTLYVVRNQLNKVAVIKLNASGTRGRLVDTLTSKDFDIPTTVAAFGNSLYLPNARFTTPPTPNTPYWITRIDRR
ncbi:MAG TPA: superoxide dismutase [Propionibacteriaceae bacterium]